MKVKLKNKRCYEIQKIYFIKGEGRRKQIILINDVVSDHKI